MRKWPKRKCDRDRLTRIERRVDEIDEHILRQEMEKLIDERFPHGVRREDFLPAMRLLGANFDARGTWLVVASRSPREVTTEFYEVLAMGSKTGDMVAALHRFLDFLERAPDEGEQ